MPPLRCERVRPASFALAGLAVLADWIGSHQEWFPYRAPGDFQTTHARPGRTQTFHYGFDAFGDHNPLPDASADSLAAAFNGRTMAWLATTHGGGVISGLDRMRGNVTLHACIGGGGCQDGDFTAPADAAKPTDANELTGAIHDLEIALPGGA